MRSALELLALKSGRIIVAGPIRSRADDADERALVTNTPEREAVLH
jgi:hypothetical protein